LNIDLIKIHFAFNGISNIRKMESKGKIKFFGKHFTQRDKEILKNLLINYYNIIKNKKQIILVR